MAPARAEGALLRAEELEPADKLEEAAKLHFQALQEKVFSKLQIDFDQPDPNAPHGLAVTQLHLLAASGPELVRSVVFGLAYAFLAWDWGRSTGYWSYLSLVRTLDSFDVMVRTLLALVRRCRTLQPGCLARLFLLVEDMADARWPELERVLLALQRELHPGVSWPGARSALAALLELALGRAQWLAADDAAAQLTFLWAARWAGAFSQEDGLRRSALDLASTLWDRAPSQILKAGPAMTWVLLPCRDEPRLGDAWRQCSEREELLARALPQACLDHLLGAEEQEHLAFTVAAERHQDRYFSWFASRHLQASLGGAELSSESLPGAGAHLGDVALCALAAGEGAGCSRPGLWSSFWELSGEQGRSALLFAALRQGYGREALSSALAADPDPPAARAAAARLARSALPLPAGAALSAELATA